MTVEKLFTGENAPYLINSIPDNEVAVFTKKQVLSIISKLTAP